MMAAVQSEVHVVAKSSEHLVFDTRVGFHLVARSYFQVLYIPSERTQEISSQVALREIKVKCMHSRLHLPDSMRLPSKAASLSERYNSSDKQVYKCAILISIQANDPLAHSLLHPSHVQQAVTNSLEAAWLATHLTSGFPMLNVVL